MMNETLGLSEMGRVAKNSSVRAYAGHAACLRDIFAVQNLNLTEYARTFGLYKQVVQSKPKYKSALGKRSDKEDNKQ